MLLVTVYLYTCSVHHTHLCLINSNDFDSFPVVFLASVVDKRAAEPAVQHADIPPPRSTTLDLHPVARKLVLIFRPVGGRWLSRRDTQ